MLKERSKNNPSQLMVEEMAEDDSGIKEDKKYIT